MIMEVGNGIIIDGVLHEPVQDEIGCEKCSLLSVCQKFNVVCTIIGCEAFVNRGKIAFVLFREGPDSVREMYRHGTKLYEKKRNEKYRVKTHGLDGPTCKVQVRKWYGWVTIKEFDRILRSPGNVISPVYLASELLDKLEEEL